MTTEPKYTDAQIEEERQAAMQVQKHCPECGTHEIELTRTCHNSACSGYAQSFTIFEGWKEAAIPVRAGVVSDEDVESACEKFFGEKWPDYIEEPEMCRISMRIALEHFAAIAQPVSVPESHALETYRLAARCLWIAFTWNDHNFDSAKHCARKDAEMYGIHNIEDANAWLEKAAPKREGE